VGLSGPLILFPVGENGAGPRRSRQQTQKTYAPNWEGYMLIQITWVHRVSNGTLILVLLMVLQLVCVILCMCARCVLYLFIWYIVLTLHVSHLPSGSWAAVSRQIRWKSLFAMQDFAHGLQVFLSNWPVFVARPIWDDTKLCVCGEVLDCLGWFPDEGALATKVWSRLKHASIAPIVFTDHALHFARLFRPLSTPSSLRLLFQS
jgi:hypothetical protein